MGRYYLYCRHLPNEKELNYQSNVHKLDIFLSNLGVAENKNISDKKVVSIEPPAMKNVKDAAYNRIENW